MKNYSLLGCLIGAVALAGCASPKPDLRTSANPLLEKQFVYEVLRHVYRWHFDQSYALGAGQVDALEVWARPLHPRLDRDDRSEFAELWIPAVNTRVELKRSDYTIAEMKIEVVDRSFKVKRVTRQARPPASRAHYEIKRYAVPEIRDYLFATRTNRVPISDNLRAAARRLVFEHLNKTHPAPFTTDQIVYIAPISSVCNDIWVFWETGRKVMLFSADADLSNPGVAQLSQLRLDVIDLDKDVVTSTKEVPGSNAFVTKDWVGRLFFNCILYGDRVVKTPEEIDRLRNETNAKATR
jgi:hypothetical protein